MTEMLAYSLFVFIVLFITFYLIGVTCREVDNLWIKYWELKSEQKMLHSRVSDAEAFVKDIVRSTVSETVADLSNVEQPAKRKRGRPPKPKTFRVYKDTKVGGVRVKQIKK